MRMRAWYLVPALLVLAACSTSTLEPPERDGPAALVDTGNGKQLWLAMTQEEQRWRNIGGRGSSSRWVTEYHYHLRLQAHDPATAQRLWSKDLKVVRDKEGGSSAQVRILGQQGDLVWTWAHDQPLALSAGDGAVVADRAKIEQANPELVGLLPNELKFYTWMGELVVTLADARRVRIVPPGLRAEPYAVANDEQFRHAGSMTSTWNGSSDTKEFGVRHGRFGEAWIGLLSEAEARDGENDGDGDHYVDSASINDERELARRGFWRMSESGYNRDFLVYGGGKRGVQGFCEDRVSTAESREDSELLMRVNDIEEYSRRRGVDPETRRKRIRACLDGFDAEKYRRIVKLERIAGAGEWLQGRMLKAVVPPGPSQWAIVRGLAPKPAAIPPLRMQDPDGVLVLHRTRMDAQGRLAISRVDGTFSRTLWTAVLPFAELGSRWEIGTHLLLYGGWSEQRAGVTSRHEGLVSLDLASGRWQGWNVGADAALEAVADS